MDPGTIMTGISILGKLFDVSNKDEAHQQELEMKQREMELAEKKQKVDSNIKYAKTAAEIGIGIAGLFLEHKRQQAQMQQYQQPVQQLQPQPQIQQPQIQFQQQMQRPTQSQQKQIQKPQVQQKVQLQTNSTVNFRVDYNSIWFDKNKGMIGAKIKNESTGRISNYAYFMQQVNDNVMNILESVDGNQWRQVGFVDFSYMTPANLGTEQTGGFIFGEIFKRVFNNQNNQPQPNDPKMIATTTNNTVNYHNNSSTAKSISKLTTKNSTLKKNSPFKTRFDMIDAMITKPHKSNENIKKELRKLEKEVERQRSGIAMRMIGDYYLRIKCEQEANSCYAKADSF